MKIKKLLVLLIMMLCAFSITACNKDDDSKYDLVISCFNGGYGVDWINNLAKRFEEAKGVKVKVKSSTDSDAQAYNNIIKGTKLSDIYIGENIAWKTLSSDGLLEDLTSVYNSNVSVRDGNGGTKEITIKEFMDDTVVDYFYSKRTTTSTTYVPYAMPWTVKTNAMAYNNDILVKIKHNTANPVSEECISEGKWVKPPVTYSDLLAFCEDVATFNNGSSEKGSDTHSYVPFGFAGGANADSLGFLVITWWAELQGLETSNYQGEGSYYDFFNLGNTYAGSDKQTYDLNYFKQSGLIESYNKLANLIIDSETKNYKNTLTNPYNKILQVLQQAFVSNNVTEKPVLSIAASYLENEVIKNRYIDSDKDGNRDVNFLFMNVPKLDYESDNLLYANLTDSIVVPVKAAHKDLAKEFLVFMSSEQEIDNFAKDTSGGIRPFECDVRTSVTGNAYTDFANSLFEVYYNSTKFYEYPANVDNYDAVSNIYRFDQEFGYHQAVDWLTIVQFLQSPTTGKTSGQSICDEVFTRVSNNAASTWKSKYRVNPVK